MAISQSGILGESETWSFCGAVKQSITLLGLLALFFTPVSWSADEYVLGPEDELEITVWKEADLSKMVTVRPDGRISFPLVGELMVAGKSVAQVQSDITKKVRKYIPEALASVAVAEVASYRVYVLGEVNKPGQYILGTYVDVVKAITLAEGLTPYAKQSDIKIIRREGSGEKVYRFNYDSIKKGKNLAQNINLKSGDVIVVP